MEQLPPSDGQIYRQHTDNTPTPRSVSMYCLEISRACELMTQMLGALRRKRVRILARICMNLYMLYMIQYILLISEQGPLKGTGMVAAAAAAHLACRSEVHVTAHLLLGLAIGPHPGNGSSIRNHA